MSPGFGPVETEVFSESFTCKSFLGGEDSRSNGFSLGFVKSEDTGWSSILIFTFGSEILDNGSHEDIVSICLELNWNFSFVSSVSIISWEVIFLLNKIIITVGIGR
jgi:hypothetical protein